MDVHISLKMFRYFKLPLTLLALITTSLVQIESVPVPSPQVLPGQVPPHLATHPALSSLQQGRENLLHQFAYNTQNRRGPSPSPLVLQNNQEANLQLANAFASQRSGQNVLPHAPGHNHGHGHDEAKQDPALRAFAEIQKYKGQQQQQPQGQNAYNPVPLTQSSPAHLNQHQHHHQHGAESALHGPLPDDGDQNEREDIRRLKALLQLAGRPTGPASTPNIGVVSSGQRGVLNPAQFGQSGPPPQQPFPNPSQAHGHDHDHRSHPTPFPETAQSQNSLGTLQFGHGSPRPPYPGSGGPNNPVVHLPYNGAGAHQHAHAHGHEHHQHGQDARTLIQSVETPPEAYQNLVYIDPVRDPNSINKHVEPDQSIFILPASDYTSDDYQRLLNRPAEILIDVLPKEGSRSEKGDFSLHNFSLLLTPSNYARCAQATHKRGYGGKCKLILKVGKNNAPFTKPQPVSVSYSK